MTHGSPPSPHSPGWLRRTVRLVLLCAGVLVVGLGAALAYFIYTPAPEVPPLSASLQRGSVRVGERERSYAFYVPANPVAAPPLLLAFHGSMGNAAQMRRLSGYRFEQLADEHGFLVVYPEGYEGHWNDCRKTGPYAAKRLGIDDVGFTRSLVAHFRSTHNVDSSRVFAVGISNGAHFVYRLALEAPDVVGAIAAVAANLPTDENFDCTPARGTVATLIINGTEDPINPYDGGRVTIFGFGDRGTVRSARESAAWFARRNGIAGAPTVERLPQDGSGSTSAERTRWPSAADADVVLYTIRGGGHALPQSRVRAPRLLGRTHSGLDGPAEIWRFFAQRDSMQPTKERSQIPP